MADPSPYMAAAAVLILLGVLASKVSDRLGVPALLLFLGIGMLAGSEGIGRIAFDDVEAAQAFGVVALAFILFGGGFDTEWTAVKPVLREGLVLATLGVVGTAVAVGVVASWVLDLPLTSGMLLGSIVSSTDAAAVFAVMRSRNVSLKGNLRPLLELESGSNDPMAVFLTIAFIEVVNEPGTSIADIVPLFLTQAILGAALGYAAGMVAVRALNWLRLGYDGLYPVCLLAIVLVTYGTTALLGGSGFLAVYIAGVVMNNSAFVHKKSLMRFSDGIAWLMQIAMFSMLGLLVFPSQLWPVAGKAMVISAALIFVARPIVTALVLFAMRFGARETALVSWVGLRGAVPVVLATFPLVEEVPNGDLIFNVVFFVVLTSVLVQGTTIPLVAGWLGVDAPIRHRPTYPVESIHAGTGATDLHELAVPDGSPAIGRQLLELGLPHGALVVLISRRGDFVVPMGSTTVDAGDMVLLLADQGSLDAARTIILGTAK